MSNDLELKQRFDNSLLWADNVENAHVTIQVRMESEDGQSNAVIILMKDQCKQLIKFLQDFVDKAE